ncbi:MAG: hypothetical protein WC467_03950 [Patescibacteria group bacterium]
MKNFKKMLPAVRQEKSCHIIALVFGIFFGIIGSFSRTEIDSLLGKVLFSASVGLIIGLFMALSTANNASYTAKNFIRLGIFYAIRIALVSFLFMIIASAFR